jgi:hypothetical protein
VKAPRIPDRGDPPLALIQSGVVSPDRDANRNPVPSAHYGACQNAIPLYNPNVPRWVGDSAHRLVMIGQPNRRMRDPREVGRGRHGRGVSRARFEPRRTCCSTCGSQPTEPTRSCAQRRGPCGCSSGGRHDRIADHGRSELAGAAEETT